MDSFISLPGKGVAELRALISRDSAEGQLKFGGTANSKGGAWENAWRSDITPWDTVGNVQPPLLDLFAADRCGIDWKALADGGRGKSIVPGCGRGYDPIFFANRGFDSYGVDLSPTAVSIAEKFLKSSRDPPKNIIFDCNDFFSSPLLKKQDFVLGFDYTFLVAIPEKFRIPWAARFSELIKPGGYLICLMFPLDGNRPGGPPYSLSPDYYSQLLNPTFDLVWLEAPDAENSARGHEGKEMISVWKRK